MSRVYIELMFDSDHLEFIRHVAESVRKGDQAVLEFEVEPTNDEIVCYVNGSATPWRVDVKKGFLVSAKHQGIWEIVLRAENALMLASSLINAVGIRLLDLDMAVEFDLLYEDGSEERRSMFVDRGSDVPGTFLKEALEEDSHKVLTERPFKDRYRAQGNLLL